MKAMYGKKLGMTRVFVEGGESVPVTVLEMSDNVVYQRKSKDSDGYESVQVGIGEQKPQRVNRPLTAHFAKAKKGMPEFVGEIRLDSVGQKQYAGEEDDLNVGDVISVDTVFEAGTRVDVSGTTIGKGTAGVVKRHGMKGAQTMTHGTHEFFRHAGSIGCSTHPGRVFKNKRMAGRMGVKKRYQEGLEIVAVRPEDKALLIKGSVPGPKNSYVFVRHSLKT